MIIIMIVTVITMVIIVLIAIMQENEQLFSRKTTKQDRDSLHPVYRAMAYSGPGRLTDIGRCANYY